MTSLCVSLHWCKPYLIYLTETVKSSQAQLLCVQNVEQTHSFKSMLWHCSFKKINQSINKSLVLEIKKHKDVKSMHISFSVPQQLYRTWTVTKGLWVIQLQIANKEAPLSVLLSQAQTSSAREPLAASFHGFHTLRLRAVYIQTWYCAAHLWAVVLSSGISTSRSWIWSFHLPLVTLP